MAPVARGVRPGSDLSSLAAPPPALTREGAPPSSYPLAPEQVVIEKAPADRATISTVLTVRSPGDSSLRAVPEAQGVGGWGCLPAASLEVLGAGAGLLPRG